MKLSLIAGLACVALSASSWASEPNDLCVVLRDIDQYEGQNLVLRGELRTDFTHIAGIADSRCPDTFLVFGESGGDELWFAMQRLRREGGDLRLTAEGEIGPGRDINGVTYRFVLNVRTFSDLTYIPPS